MEEMKVENELTICGVKRDSLVKQLEKLHSQSSDILIFSLQWKDLEDHLRSTEDKVENRFRELALKETELEDKNSALEKRAKVVEAAEAQVANLETKSDGLRMGIEEKSKQMEILLAESNAEELRLTQIRKSVEECSAEEISKRSQLNEMVESLRKTQVELDMAREQFTKMETDLERYRVEVSAEMEYLDNTHQSRWRELDDEIERKTKDLTSVREETEECEKLLQIRSSELVKTRGELELNGKKLGQMMIDLDRSQNRDRELDDEIERKTKDLALVREKTEKFEKLLEIRSSELVKTQGELELTGKQLGQMKIDLDESQIRNRELEEEMERKRKDLEAALHMIAECGKQRELVEEELDSKQKLLETLSIEVVSKEKKHNEMNEAIRKLSLKIESEDKKLEKASEFSQKQHSKEKEMDSTRRGLAKCKAEYDSTRKELRSVKDKLRDYVKDLEIKEKKLKSLKSAITERNILIEEREKMGQHLDNSIKELNSQLKLKQEEVCAINKAIKECSGEIEAKTKHRDQVQSSIGKLTAERKANEIDLNFVKKQIQDSLKDRDKVQSSIINLTADLKSKQSDLDSIKKKIEDSLKDLQSKEEKQIRLKASLMEREQGLELKAKELDAEKETIELKGKELDAEKEKIELKGKELDAEKEKIELKGKELDAREEKIDKKDEELKSTEQKLANCVKDIELKAKTLSSFMQQSNTGHDLVRDANVSDKKTLQLLLRGHQLHLDISRSLEASSDPAKLVLDTIQGLYSAHQRTAVTNLDPNSVRRSSIQLLECLMDMSVKPLAELQEEAFKFATEWKNTTPVNTENPVEVLRFLHFLAVFSLAYTFDDDKIKNLFDVAFLRKYAPSLCKALGVSALTPVNNVLSLDVKPTTANEDVLGDFENSTSFLPNEVSTRLPMIDDPGRFVLSSVDEALKGAQRRGELCLADPILKALIPLLEELPRVGRSIGLSLQSDASTVAAQWSLMMGKIAQTSQLEAWAFLHFIVAYRLAEHNQDQTLRFASSVAHFKEAPKLFSSLGLGYAIPNFVEVLVKKALYIPAIRFIFYFNLKNNFVVALDFLKNEIINLRHSAQRFESEVGERDAGRMRDIIELIKDFKLDINVPGDLIVKFMVPREIQNQNQCVQVPQILHMQTSHTVIQNSYITTNGSTAFQGQSSYHAGFKRPRLEDSRSAIRFNPRSGFLS